jgi:hypothetical protein
MRGQSLIKRVLQNTNWAEGGRISAEQIPVDLRDQDSSKLTVILKRIKQGTQMPSEGAKVLLNIVTVL